MEKSLFEIAELQVQIFLSVLALMLLLETIFPRVKNTQQKIKRDLINLMLSTFNSILIKIFFPVSAFTFCLLVEDKGYGLFNSIRLEFWLESLLSILILDLGIYFQHRIFHRVPILWKLHRSHHMDKDMTTTTGNRFHPIEIVLSMLIKFLFILIFGIHGTPILIFFILLNASSMFNHTNFYLPRTLDSLLKLIIVTPDMHRIHHSEVPKETNSNYGFFLSIWDRIFKSYTHKDFDRQQEIHIGLKEFNAKQATNFIEILKNPFI